MKNNKDNCSLIEKFSPEFIKMIDATKNDGNERSVNFCPNNGDIYLSNICIGNSCSIPNISEREIECKENKIAIGNMHTHPGLGVQYGLISENDILNSIARDKKFACIGYRGIAKSINCYDYPFGMPIEEAKKFKNMNYYNRDYKLTTDLKKYGIELAENRYIRKSDTPNEKWKKLTDEANSLTDLRDKFRKYIITQESKEERERNSCTLFLSPLNDND